MKLTKISLAILILICAVGMVAAVEISDIKVAEGFENLGAGNYVNDANNVYIDIINEKEVKPLKSIFENDSNVKHTVVPGKLNNTFNYTDGVNLQAGIDELVKINDKEYVIEFYAYDDDNVSMDKIYDALEEFNKLNNLTPIDPSTLE
ncbi:hypothetical protein [Methanobrevibacter sp.]|uniref:hypothetical protein n=1 Tax=Methanobrevibacter sp. TaxID=66852 RepID=UPI00386C70B5